MGDGRANPNQLAIVDDNVDRAARGLATLLQSGHYMPIAKHSATTDDLFVGLQLTHCGRFCKPRDKKRLEPKIAYHHPLLDPKFGIGRTMIASSSPTMSFAGWSMTMSAPRSSRSGSDFNSSMSKHCHGYLGHELLSGFHPARPIRREF